MQVRHLSHLFRFHMDLCRQSIDLTRVDLCRYCTCCSRADSDNHIDLSLDMMFLIFYFVAYVYVGHNILVIGRGGVGRVNVHFHIWCAKIRNLQVKEKKM